jgi:hypothetical protein
MGQTRLVRIVSVLGTRARARRRSRRATSSATVPHAEAPLRSLVRPLCLGHCAPERLTRSRGRRPVPRGTPELAGASMPSRRWPANLSPRRVACSHAVTRRSRTAFPNAPTTYLSALPPPSHEHTLCRRPPRLPREQPQLAGSIRRPRATFLQFLPPAAPQPLYSRSPPPLIVPEPLRRGPSQNFRPPYHVRVRST